LERRLAALDFAFTAAKGVADLNPWAASPPLTIYFPIVKRLNVAFSNQASDSKQSFLLSLIVEILVWYLSDYAADFAELVSTAPAYRSLPGGRLGELSMTEYPVIQ
jgi:hypothetical protein